MLFRQAFAVILLTLLAFSGIAFSQQKEQRIALVIGNSAYKVSPLKNPVNDARDMANSLRGYGFTVIERNNLTVKQIGSTLREFRSKLSAGSVALVFYAGHGIQIKGENYLPAVDADIVGEEDVPNQSLSTRQIMDVLADAKSRMNLVFLDACRDNPYARSFRSSSRGLGRENAPSGTLISFATRPGSTAADGDGRNGLYTSVLLQQIKNTDQPIEQVLKRVVTGVKTASKGQQEPWMEGSIEGDFCFGLCGTSLANTTYQPQVVSPDVALWESVKDSRNVDELKVYLSEFPKGIFAGIARARINALTEKVSSLEKNTVNTQDSQSLLKIKLDGSDFFAGTDEVRDYEAALNLFRKGDFLPARDAFISFNSRYPNSGYGFRSLFWLGNAQYVNREYKDAIKNFYDIFLKSPSHLIAPDALLSIANCQLELRDIKSASETFKTLISYYPNTESALLAKERFSKINK